MEWEVHPEQEPQNRDCQNNYLHDNNTIWSALFFFCLKKPFRERQETFILSSLSLKPQIKGLAKSRAVMLLDIRPLQVHTGMTLKAKNGDVSLCLSISNRLSCHCCSLSCTCITPCIVHEQECCCLLGRKITPSSKHLTRCVCRGVGGRKRECVRKREWYPTWQWTRINSFAIDFFIQKLDLPYSFLICKWEPVCLFCINKNK